MGMITYRTLTTAEELVPCVEVQVKTWLMPESEAVPVHQLLTAAKYGGVVVGALDGETLIGFAYGFVGLYHGQPILCSHMNAVLPEYRGRGIGAGLKLEQRRFCLEQGLTVMHWTYDPLELVNGNLNIRRLGATSRTYVQNQYGEMRDSRNAGLPSDRLVVEWELVSPRVLQALQHGRAPAPERSGCEPYDGTNLPGDGRPLALTLPEQFQALKQQDPAAALRWRLLAREAFERAFAAGYRLTGAFSDGYIFTRDGGTAT